MFIGNINTIPSIVNLPGQGTTTFKSKEKFIFTGGSGVLRSPVQANYRFADEITISCWVTFGDQLFDYTGAQKNYMIVDQAQGNFSNGYSLYVTKTASNSTLLRFHVGRGAIGDERVQIPITNIVPDSDKVFFIMATFSSNPGIKLYLKSFGIDLSAEKTPGPGPITYNNATNNFCIGNTAPTGTSEFEGSIDEVGIFEKSLSDSNADEIYDWNRNGNLLRYNANNNLNLTAWYRMGEDAEFQENPDPKETGVWTMKNAVNIGSTQQQLTSAIPSDPAKGNLSPSAKSGSSTPGNTANNLPNRNWRIQIQNVTANPIDIVNFNFYNNIINGDVSIKLHSNNFPTQPNQLPITDFIIQGNNIIGINNTTNNNAQVFTVPGFTTYAILTFYGNSRTVEQFNPLGTNMSTVDKLVGGSVVSTTAVTAVYGPSGASYIDPVPFPSPGSYEFIIQYIPQ